MTFEELEDHYKTYSSLRKDMGKILVQVSTRVNIKALIQWARNLLRTGKEPHENIFTLDNKATLLTQIGTYQHWVDNANIISKTAMPQPFTDKSRWEDWKITFYERKITKRPKTCAKSTKRPIFSRHYFLLSTYEILHK